ncbi:MAG: class I SAM-dependent methyltransferase [Alphaproteobacteria bacterium]
MTSRLFVCVLRALERGRAPKLRRSGWKLLYGVLGCFWRDDDWRFMNYGWLPPESAGPLALEPADEPDRPFIGLYDHAARGLPIEGARVLEIGSGRGGGARYVARYFDPAEVVGVDFSAAAVALSKKLNADTPNLTFKTGDAEALPFPDASFDIVLNIESSHCYGDVAAFVRETARVLKPGGSFSWVDMRSDAMVQDTDRILLHADFRLDRAEILSADVVRALDAANDRKIGRIARIKFLRRFMTEFAGTKDSLLYRGLKSGKVVYLSRRFQKLN